MAWQILILNIVQRDWLVTFIPTILAANPIFIYRVSNVILASTAYQGTAYQGLANWNNLHKSLRDIKSLLVLKQAL